MDAEIISEAAKLSAKFSVVKPSCGADTCPGCVTSRPKKVKTTIAQRGQKRKKLKAETKEKVSKRRKTTNGSKGVSSKSISDFLRFFKKE